MLKIYLPRIVLLAAAAAVLTIILLSAEGIGGPSDGSSTFLQQFVISGGPIVWFILLPMSFCTVYLAVERTLLIRRKNLLPNGTAEKIRCIIHCCSLPQLKDHLAKQRDIVSMALARTLAAPTTAERMRISLAESVSEQGQVLLQRIEWLNLIGNVSPMVGLFGTVFGMIKLFNAIVFSGGQPQPAQMAGGISVALVTTFWGLLIAIPALAVQSILRSRVESIIADAAAQAEDILSEIIYNAARTGREAAVQAAKPAQSAGPTKIAEVAQKKTVPTPYSYTKRDVCK